MDKLHFHKLDTLRFFAFFLVFWHHGFGGYFSNIDFLDKRIVKGLTLTGGMGVHIFFVISGFLITFLLLKEYRKNYKINIGRFYMRRILRIWPLYYLIMILGMFILPHLSSVFYTSQNEYLNLLFLNNFETDKAVSTTVYIAWSVAIEEQFYLFWPLIFAIFAKNTRYLAIFCALVYIGSSLFILYRPDISYDHTLGNLNYLMVGALGAIALNNSEKKIPEFLYKKWPVLLLNSIAIVLLFIYKPAGYFFIMPFLYLLLVLYVVSLDKLSATTRSKKEVFSFLGKYTYGMYMYHPMFILATKIVFDVCSLNYKDSLLLNMAIGIISLTATIVVAYLSYEYFEKHFLKYKERFSVIKTRI